MERVGGRGGRERERIYAILFKICVIFDTNLFSRSHTSM